MARPPHEDPEYQRQLVGTYRQGLLSMSSQQQSALQQHPHLQHYSQQLQQQQQQHQQQLGAAIKPPLPGHQQAAATAAQLHLHQQQHSLNNNNNNISNSSSNNNALGSQHAPGSNGSSSGSSNGGSGSSSGAVLAHSNTSPLIHHNYTWSQVSPTSPQKHVRLSPRPSYPYPSPNYSNQIAQQHHYQQQQQLSQIQLSPGGTNYHQQSALGALSGSGSASQVQSLNGGAGPFVTPGSSPGSAASNRSPLSPNRRTRGENKKCRKVYGMDHKEQWCTQCKWKKACSRFGD